MLKRFLPPSPVQKKKKKVILFKHQVLRDFSSFRKVTKSLDDEFKRYPGVFFYAYFTRIRPHYGRNS